MLALLDPAGFGVQVELVGLLVQFAVNVTEVPAATLAPPVLLVIVHTGTPPPALQLTVVVPCALSEPLVPVRVYVTEPAVADVAVAMLAVDVAVAFEEKV